MENQSRQNPGSTMFRDAATDGAIIGGLLFACMLLDEFTRPALSGIISIVKLLVMVGCIYIFTRRRSMSYGSNGFTFAQGITYIIVMMVFTGVITGVGDFLAFNMISPDYYNNILEENFEKNPLLKLYSDPMLEQSLGMAKTILRNPLYFIFAGIVGKVFGGGIIGLFVSAFVKRLPVSIDNE